MSGADAGQHILVGQYDSPFVRRAAIALNHHGIPFERRVVSVFQDFDAVLSANPLGKVPVLILPHGDTLADSRAIIEYVDGSAAARRLVPVDPAGRLQVLRIEAVGIGLAEKIYERGIEFSRRRPGSQDPDWIARLERQISSALGWLEGRATDAWFIGDAITRADLAVAVAVTYVREKLPALFRADAYPRLAAHCRRCEAMPIFSDAAYSQSEAMATGWRPEDDE